MQYKLRGHFHIRQILNILTLETFMKVGPSGSFPLIGQEGFVIKPGHENIVAVSSVRVDADVGMISLGSSNRNCFFPEENQLMRIHRNYSYSNCMFECAFSFAEQELFKKREIICQPWFYPSPYNVSTICDPWQSFDFLNFMIDDLPDDTCSHCLPDCGGTTYEPMVTSYPFGNCDFTNIGQTRFCDYQSKKNWPMSSKVALQIIREFKADSDIYTYNVPTYLWYLSQNYIRMNGRDLSNGDVFVKTPQTYVAFEKDIAWVEIYIPKSSVLQIGSQQTMTWIDYFSAVGGLLGLVLGMGIVSFVELIWLCLRMAARKLNLNDWIV